MRYGSRRKLDVFLLGLFGLAVGGLGALGAAIGDSERIQRYWSSAVIDAGQADEQRAQITELIDYDFGSSSRRGILRDVEDLDPGAAVEVSSPTAPDDVTLLSQPGGAVRIRIGDPDITIRGRHQYRIGFPLVVAQAGGPVFWDAIGTRWEVGIEEVELHLTGATEFTDVLCSTGEGGTWGGCTAEQVEPGHLVVRIDGLSAGEGVTISATPGAPLATAPAPPTPPTDVPDDPGTGILPPFLVALGAAIAAAAGLSRVVRRQGREQVWAGGAADAAYGPQLGQDFPTRLVDHDELSQLASIEFTPPKGLTPWQGGVLHREAAGSDQEVAWLLERAIDGTVQIDGIEVDDRGKVDGDLSLTRIPEADGALDPADRDLLDGLFGGRPSITLDSYDKQFAAGWSDLGTHLQSWNDTARFWDPAGDRRRGRARILGVLALLVGVAITIGTAVLANRVGPVALVGVAVGAGIAGAGIGLLTRSWELRVRTPEGSGLWILVESFRRFIEGSEAQHVEDAARQGLLREYTAWATALGEADHWADAVGAADLDPEVYGDQQIGLNALSFAAVAPQLASATSSAATAPSSSGSSGGSVGGGAGGGGGGSW